MTIPDLSAIGNHLWQSTAFAAVAWLLTLLLRKNSARVRHAVWFAASVKFLVPISWLIELGGRIHWSNVPLAQPAVSLAIDQISTPFSAAAPPRVVPQALNPMAILLVGIWTLGFLGIAVSWMVRYWRIRACARTGLQLSLDLPVQAISCSAAMEPGVFGIFRPVLLLPDGIFERLTDSQLSAVIEHELCHVRRRDNLVASIQMLVETVFWFHPLVWWIGKRMVAERELGCDEEVLRRGNVRVSYAEGILNVCRLYAESPLACASGVTGADLKRRIQAIVAGRAPLEMTVARKVGLGAAAVVALAAPLLAGVVHASSAIVPTTPQLIAQALPERQAPVAKPPAAPTPLVFEAVSIKPIIGQWGGVGIRPSGSRVIIQANTIGNLISWAYGVKEFQVLGGPAWTGSEGRYEGAIRYDIEAKAEGEATHTPAEFREMTKAMLADRFQLTMHHAQKMIPVYALLIDKGGPKFKESGPDSPHGMNMHSAPEGDGMEIVFEGREMSLLAGEFSNINGSDRPVFDETGLKGTYDFKLDWDIPRAGRESSLPTIFTAMRDQLGLRLEPKTEPVDVLVIDHVEKPSEN
jgi:uncharacterized protein (TIGR03435 family)